MKSKFKLWAFLILIMTLLFAFIPYFLLLEITNNHISKPDTPLFFIMGLIIFTLIWLIVGELRTKTIKVEIDHEKIVSTNFLGLGTTQVFYFTDLDELKISFLPSRGGTYEYLYLIKDKKKVIKISEFYHRNYSELKQTLLTKTKSLGIERFSYFKELKEIFI